MTDPPQGTPGPTRVDGTTRRVDGTTRVVGVFGDPVAHTASPAMHNAAFAALDLNWVYAAFRVPRDRLASALRGVVALGMPGVNLTVPLKEEAVECVDRLDPSAEAVGAVNTVVVGDDGTTTGHNTDGAGFLAAVREEFRLEPAGLRIAIVGVGGAGRAVAIQCALAGVARLVLLNRTLRRAEEVAGAVRAVNAGTEVRVGEPAELDRGGVLDEIDLVVNGTSLGLRGDDDPSPVPAESMRPGLLAYDLVYRPTPTPMMRAAAVAGARAADGLGMLLHQGALAFRLWTGRDAPVEVMRSALRETVGGR